MRPYAALIVLVLGLAPAVHAQESPAAATPQLPTIVTTGEATVRRAPDRAFVTIAVDTRARTPRDAQQQNAQAMTTVQQRLGAAGIPKDAIRTTGYSIQQEFDFANGKRTPRGYAASNGVEVRVDAVERVGDVLDAMVDAGATSVSGVRFDLKDRAGAEREALRLAVVDGRARAEAIASGAGRTIERILRVVDAPQPRFKGAPQMMLERSVASAADASTPIAPGEIEIRAEVEVTALFR